jgi:hypothetical protein
LARSSPAFHDTSAAEKKKMVDARKYYATVFIPLEDLADGPRQKPIERVEEGKYGKLVLIFADNSAVSLNATNSRALVEAFGWDTDDWPGHVVELSAGELEYQGKLQPAILVKPVDTPPVEKPVAKLRGEGIDDSIPF